MPSIAFFSPKGGSGKTTAALVLAHGLVERGHRVAMIDADPNKPLVRWAALPDRPERIRVHPALTMPDIVDVAHEAQRRSPDWLIVDTEGSERGAMALSAMRFDAVLTPLSGSVLDLHEATKASQMVKAHSKRSSKPIVHRALLTRISPVIKTRTLKIVVDQLRLAKLDILPTPLFEKEAFRALFQTGAGFAGLESCGVRGAAAARENTVSYVDDVEKLIQALTGPKPGGLAPD